MSGRSLPGCNGIAKLRPNLALFNLRHRISKLFRGSMVVKIKGKIIAPWLTPIEPGATSGKRRPWRRGFAFEYYRAEPPAKAVAEISSAHERQPGTFAFSFFFGGPPVAKERSLNQQAPLALETKSTISLHLMDCEI